MRAMEPLRLSQSSYISAISDLIRATETNTATCGMIVSLFNEMKATLDDSGAEIVDLGSDYSDVLSRLDAFDFKKVARIGEGLLDARNDLLLGLSEAHAGWVSGDGMQQTESWFSEKAEAMRNLVDLYEADIAKNMEMLTELQLLSAQLWLAISHSMMIRV